MATPVPSDPQIDKDMEELFHEFKEHFDLSMKGLKKLESFLDKVPDKHQWIMPGHLNKSILYEMNQYFIDFMLCSSGRGGNIQHKLCKFIKTREAQSKSAERTISIRKERKNEGGIY